MDTVTGVHIAAAYGAVGGLLVEVYATARFLNVYKQVPWSLKGKKRVRAQNGQVVSYVGIWTYLFAVVLRAVLGAGVAMVLFLQGPLTPSAAIVAGMAAYAVMDEWARGAELPNGQPPSTAEEVSRG